MIISGPNIIDVVFGVFAFPKLSIDKFHFAIPGINPRNPEAVGTRRVLSVKARGKLEMWV